MPFYNRLNPYVLVRAGYRSRGKNLAFACPSMAIMLEKYRKNAKNVEICPRFGFALVLKITE